MDQNNKNNVMMDNSRTTWPTKILEPFLSSLNNLQIYNNMHILFFKKVLTTLR